MHTAEVPATTLTGGGTRFFTSVTRDRAKGMTYIKLVNASSEPQPVKLDLGGAAKVQREATLVTLSGTNPAETNTITAPKRIVPVTSTLKTAAESFTHTVPPFAIEVLALSTK